MRTSEHPEYLVQIKPAGSKSESNAWWEPHFPRSRTYRKPHANQVEAWDILGKGKRLTVLELPTGSGKTLIAYVWLKDGQANGEGPLFYITPNKTLVQQVLQLHPDVTVAYGRNEYPCLYYEPDHSYKADEIPCSLLTDCPHRVDQKTGETLIGGVEPCAYLHAKYLAKQAKGIVVCTDAFHLFTHIFSKEFEKTGRLVIDEAHRIANVVRNSLSYEITDFYLWRAIELLQEIGAEEEARQLDKFTRAMIRIIKRKSPRTKELLSEDELVELIELLAKIDKKELKEQIVRAVKEGRIDKVEKREVLKKLENFTYELDRYLISLGYSLPTERHKALNYVCAYWIEEKETPEGVKVQYKLIIKAYYVAPLVKKLLSERTLAKSATIGDPDTFGFETGIQGEFFSFTSEFPAENSRVFLPTDVANLAFNDRSRGEPNKTLRRIIRAAKLFAKKGYRSLVVLISEAERKKFLQFAEEEKLDVISYGNGTLAKEAAARFKEGEGDVLVGTSAHYGEGVDLPKGVAPIIFFLRPGYPSPSDPLAKFEERRYSKGRVMALRQWRAMIQALQVRGRNVRSKTDLGACFFMSQQFSKFLRNSLPRELREAYVNSKTFDECVAETIKLLD